LTQIKDGARDGRTIASLRSETIMSLTFETAGNATLIFHEDGRPVLATDPWLEGRCYSGSWALERKLTEAELKSVLDAEYIWISHGHPDHFHVRSLMRFARGKKVLLPDHYAKDIASFLTGQGFLVEIMPYRQWRVLTPGIRCMCLDNENQDAILLIEAGDSLIVNVNDSPLCGDAGFIRRLVRRYPREKTYMTALCSNDADMINIVDDAGRHTIDPPETRKPGMVWALGRTARSLGVGAYVCSASQHIYSRADSIWANPYRVGWSDVSAHWNQPQIRAIEPFVVIDLADGSVTRKHPTQASDPSQIEYDFYGDDWEERLQPDEWARLFTFFEEIEPLSDHIDYVDFTVGGETRRIWIDILAVGKPAKKLRGVAFEAPRRSLMKALQYGYFDDMLIGNYMKTRLHNTGLYPHFTPIVAKLRGSAGVTTAAGQRAFAWRYFKRNPVGYVEWHGGQAVEGGIEQLRRLADLLGIKRPLKALYRRMLGDPVAASSPETGPPS
jgi:hypothetical protein